LFARSWRARGRRSIIRATAREAAAREAAMAERTMNAAADYAARVDAVLAQRARLRGHAPPGDLFDGLPPDHQLLRSDPRHPSYAHHGALAALIEPGDTIIDVGGGAGRVSLPLARACKAIVNVDPSAKMGAAFLANAVTGGIANVRFVHGDWLAVDPPAGTVALANHVMYLTRDIVSFLERMERAGPRRVFVTVNSPPPPTWNRVLFALVHGEPELLVPGHAELANVLWERGVLPDIRVMPGPGAAPIAPAPTRAAAIAAGLQRIGGEQWSFWPMAPDLAARARGVLETRFDELFAEGSDGFRPRWITPGQELLITWEPKR
jgi:SAM-dependent methyltransferase